MYFKTSKEFSAYPAVRTPRFHCRRYRFNPWLRNFQDLTSLIQPKTKVGVLTHHADHPSP